MLLKFRRGYEKIEEQSLAYLDTMIADSLIYEIYLKINLLKESYSDLKMIWHLY